MVKTKFWLAQLLMLSVIGLILGSPAFAKAPEHAKGVEMKNANASDKAKEKANANAGFQNDVEDPAGNGEEVDPVAVAQATCAELFGAAADFNPSTFLCTNMDTFETVQL
jgi:hypothetical protein